MQGNLIAVAYTLHTYIKTSSLWAEFVNENRCISVRLVSMEVKAQRQHTAVQKMHTPLK